jgi:hypothetical protein
MVWALIDEQTHQRSALNAQASSQSCTEIGPSPETLSIVQVVPSKAHRGSRRERAASSRYANDDDMAVEAAPDGDERRRTRR